jgi:molybdopterin-guanine dinucleotide biosynthesis protein A
MNDRFQDFQVCILAGGRSRRMGRDKTRLRLGGRTMLDQVRRAARTAGWPVRVIRRDRVPQCGPLGGVYTGLTSTTADAVLFLACDMPFVTADLIQFLLEGFSAADIAVFTRARGRAGFPFVVRRVILPVVVRQIEREEFSLQALSKVLRAKVVSPGRKFGPRLRNVNTPDDWRRARKLWEWRASRGRRDGKAGLEAPNPKLQAPEKHRYENPKHQIPRAHRSARGSVDFGI